MSRIVRAAVIGTGTMGRKYAQMIAAGQVPSMCLAAVVCRSQEAQAWARKTLPGYGAGVGQRRRAVHCGGQL